MPIMSFDENGEKVDLTPIAYKDKDWAKNINSAEDLFKQFENAQGLIGKSVQIPGEDASSEDWGKVYNKLGRPEKVEDYGLNLADTADAALKEQASLLSKIFYDNGLSKKQAARLLEGVQGMTKAQADKMAQDQTAKDATFNDLLKKTFGDKEDETKKVTRGLLEKFTPKELQDKLKDMPSEQLTILAAVLKGVSDTYISEDDIRNLGGGKAGGAKTAEEWRKEGQDLMQSEAYRNIMHVDHATTVKKASEAYKMYQQLLDKK